MYILGIDPGLAALGYCQVFLDRSTEAVISASVITTKKSDKKLNVFASDDNVRRIQELVDQLWPCFEESVRPAVICSESQSWPRNASNCAKTGMAWGAITTLARIYDVPIVMVSPKRLKEATAGHAGASKEDVKLAVLDAWPAVARCLEHVTPSKQNHAYDAAGAIMACLDSELIRALRSTIKERS